MSLPTIVVYSKSNNRNTLRLLDKESPVNLEETTKIELRLDDGSVLSSEFYPSQISWSTPPDPNGLVYLALGSLFFTTRIYTVELLVFDPENTLGIFFGLFRIRAIEESASG